MLNFQKNHTQNKDSVGVSLVEPLQAPADSKQLFTHNLTFCRLLLVRPHHGSGRGGVDDADVFDISSDLSLGTGTGDGIASSTDVATLLFSAS